MMLCYLLNIAFCIHSNRKLKLSFECVCRAAEKSIKTMKYCVFSTFLLIQCLAKLVEIIF